MGFGVSLEVCGSFGIGGLRVGLGGPGAVQLLVASLSLLRPLESFLLGQRLPQVYCDILVAFPLAMVECELSVDAAVLQESPHLLLL